MEVEVKKVDQGMEVIIRSLHKIRLAIVKRKILWLI